MDELDVAVVYPSTRNGWVDPGEVRLNINGQALVEIVGNHYDLAGLTPAELPPSPHLLGEPRNDLSVNGRAALLVCPLCGDLGCGAILAHITGGHIEDEGQKLRSFQPMNVNFGLFPPVTVTKPEGVKRWRGPEKAMAKKKATSLRALEDVGETVVHPPRDESADGEKGAEFDE